MPLSRLLVALVHWAIAGSLLFSGCYVGLQSRANMIWEHSFYGVISPTTQSLFIGSVGTCVVSIGWMAVACVYVAGARWAALVMLFVSCLFILLPPPLMWGMLLAAAAVALELWARRSVE